MTDHISRLEMQNQLICSRLYIFQPCDLVRQFLGGIAVTSLWVCVLQQAVAERHQLQDQNSQLQHRLAEIFNQRRAEDTHREEHVHADQEKRYLNYMGHFTSVCLLARLYSK